jgi:hypothetical protein
MKTAFDYQLKVKTIENIVNEYNQVHHGTYRFQGDETMGWAEVISDTTDFSGCLLSKIAFAANLYGWCFSMHTRISSLTEKETIYVLI